MAHTLHETEIKNYTVPKNSLCR